MRFKIWLLITLGVVVFGVTLTAVDSRLAGAPVGFAVIFPVLLATAFTVDWLIVKTRVPVLPTIYRAFFILLAWATFMAMGSTLTALAAFFLSLVAFGCTAIGLRRRRIKAENAQFEAAINHRYTVMDADLRAARGIPGAPWAKARQ